MIRLQYTGIKNPLLNDIPVHVYQTYANKLAGEHKDYGLADIHYTRKTTPEGVKFEFSEFRHFARYIANRNLERAIEVLE